MTYALYYRFKGYFSLLNAHISTLKLKKIHPVAPWRLCDQNTPSLNLLT